MTRTEWAETLFLPVWVPVLLLVLIGWTFGEVCSLWRDVGWRGLFELLRDGRRSSYATDYVAWRQRRIKLAAAQLTKRVIWQPFGDHLTTYTSWHWRYWWRKARGQRNGMA